MERGFRRFNGRAIRNVDQRRLRCSVRQPEARQVRRDAVGEGCHGSTAGARELPARCGSKLLLRLRVDLPSKRRVSGFIGRDRSQRQAHRWVRGVFPLPSRLLSSTHPLVAFSNATSASGRIDRATGAKRTWTAPWAAASRVTIFAWRHSSAADRRAVMMREDVAPWAFSSRARRSKDATEACSNAAVLARYAPTAHFCETDSSTRAAGGRPTQMPWQLTAAPPASVVGVQLVLRS